jgi:hypothetical protein
MIQVDVIARAIDWLDACKSLRWQRVAELYAAEARVAIPGELLRAPATLLHGISDIAAYWHQTFNTAPRAAFELVELYPGHDSVILIYYDEQYQRVSEFLEFNSEGQIKQSVRHLIPRRRQVYSTAALPDLPDETQKQTAVLRCEARQSLGEARRLPIGPMRNVLRQRAVALRALAKRGIAIQS